MGDPQNGLFIGEYPTKMDDDWGYPYDSGNPHIYHKPTFIQPLRKTLSEDIWRGPRPVVISGSFQPR